MKRYTLILEWNDPSISQDAVKSLLEKNIADPITLFLVKHVHIDERAKLCYAHVETEVSQDNLRTRLNALSSSAGFQVRTIGWGWNRDRNPAKDKPAADVDPGDPYSSIPAPIGAAQIYKRVPGVFALLTIGLFLFVAGLWMVFQTNYFVAGILLCVLVGYGIPFPGPWLSAGLTRQIRSITCDSTKMEVRYWLGFPVRLSWSDIYEIRIYENRDKWCLVSAHTQAERLPLAIQMHRFDGIVDAPILVSTMIRNSGLHYVESVDGNPVYKSFTAP